MATRQDLASAAGSTTPDGAPTGLHNYLLGALYEQDDAFGGGPGSYPPSPSIGGRADTFGAGIVLDLGVPAMTPTLRGGAGNQFFVDEASVYGEPPSPDTRPVPAEPFLVVTAGQPQEQGHVGLTRSSEPTLEKPEKIFDGRTVCLSFGFEDVRDDTGYTTRESLLQEVHNSLADEVSVPLSGAGVLNDHTILQAELESSVGSTGVRYRWDFGDGSATAETPTPQVTHVYTSTGTYTARVEARDSYGHSAIDSSPITISARFYLPVVIKSG